MNEKKVRLVERRKFIRLDVPVNISYNEIGNDTIYRATTKNISADGLRFESRIASLEESSRVELRLIIPKARNPVHLIGKVVWKRKLSSEDGAPFDVGIELDEIEEDNKNTFLKFLCDTLYNISTERPK